MTGNFIGGSAPNATGTAWTTTGTIAASLFQGIGLNVGTLTPSSVQGNTIKNMVWTSSSNANAVPGIWSGVYVEGGAVDIGTMTGNTIGSSSGTGSISVTTSGSGGTSFGIGSVSNGTVTITNNTIGSITVNGSATTVSASLTGIAVTGGGVNTISNNIVGSSATPNPLTSNTLSLNAATSSTSAGGQQVTGIFSSCYASASITGNTVANLNNNYAGTASAGIAGQIRGIATSAGVNTIANNTVRNLSTTSANTSLSETNGSATASVIGISQTLTIGGQTISQNTVHSLANTVATANVYVIGIYLSGPPSVSVGDANLIERNLIHSLAVSSTGSSAVLSGMHIFSSRGTFNVQNNMVSVGLDANGTSTAGAISVYGILDGNGSIPGSRNFYHNSVYLGGTQTSGASSSYAFFSSSQDSVRSFQNNIFVNVRSNNGATSKHYAVKYGGTSVNPAGLTASGNLLHANGTGGVLGLYNSVDRTTLSAWQAATGQDAASAVADPKFIAPTGSATTLDLHLQASNPAEGGALSISAVTDDFDGQTRSELAPVEIGADAGNFNSTGDIFAPAISYPLLTSGTTTNRVLTGWVTITDNMGVAGGASAPRLYFKKSTDADAFNVANNSTGNGWKYVTASGSGPYSFTLDYSLIRGGNVAAGVSIQYFVVAQDEANNLGSSPPAATASANLKVQSVNGHGLVNSFSIVGGSISGMKTVGTGGDYPSLSGAGGLFAALNGTVLTGNVVANITSDLTEIGSVSLSAYASNNYPLAYLTIQPDSATIRTISGSSVNSLINLKGADRVMIDGRYGGSGRYLTFRNTSNSFNASTILLSDDASYNTLCSCIVEGATTNSYGVVSIVGGTMTGNDNNVITGCQVRDLSILPGGVPYVLIGSVGSSTNVANSGNTISNNELFNCNGAIIFIHSLGNESWTFSNNNIYSGNAGISMQGGGTNGISGNYIHDLLPVASSSVIAGIYVAGGGGTTISNNRITVHNTPPTQIVGIWAEGSATSTLNMLNNQVTLTPFASGSTLLYGIYDRGHTGSRVNSFHNTIALGGTENGMNSSWASYRRGAGSHTARNNLFLNLRTGGTGSHFAAGSEPTGGSYTASHNVYAGTGATAANFMHLGATVGFGTPIPVSFSTWQSSTGDTNSQAGIAGSSNYTSAMFVNAAIGDLHLVPGGNALVNALGIPIPSVIDDYDGDPRPAGAPTIGSDEFVPSPDIAVGQTSALIDGLGSVEFGSVTVGSSSSAKTFTITNPGSAILTSLAVTGGTNEFSISSLSGTSVPVGSSSVTFSVTFTPSFSGMRSATLQIACNVIGTKNPFDILLTGTGNVPPTFPGYTLKTKKNTPVSVGLAKLLVRAADSDGGTPSISSVSATTTQGGSVSLASSSVAYAPPLNFTGLDTFGVTIIDGQGGSVVGTVTCSVSEGNAPITNEPQITRQPGGSVAILFLGIPDQIYKVQRSTDLQMWTLLETATTAPDGTLPSLDPSPPEGSAFYRIVVP